MKSTKTSRSSKPSHILVGSILALALGATPAMGDATWTGGGADTNWSNMANWSGNPMLGGKLYLDAMGSPFTSTVDIDAAAGGWTLASSLMMNANTSLYFPTGGKLGNGGGNPRMKSTGTGSPKIYVQGGYLAADIGEGTDTSSPIVEISSGTYITARITYQKYVTVNIIGSALAADVAITDFLSWKNNSLPTLGFTLDAGGVKPFKFGNHGQDSYPDGNIPGSVALNVGGIATYAAGAMPMGLVIPLVRDTNTSLFFPNAFTLGKLVDGGVGWVSRVSNGVDLTVLQPSLASVWEGGASDWSTATWNVGGTPNQAAGTKLMTVDVAASVVTVAANASSAVVAIGQTNASTVTVNAGSTLTALNGVVVGANGTLNVDGNLTATAAVLTSAGTTNFAATSGGTIGAVEVTAGTTTLAGSATFGTVYLSGTGTLAFSSPAATGTLSVSSGTITGTATANTKFIFPLTASKTVSADLAGTGGLEKDIVDKTIAATTLTLSGNNTYTGVTTVRSGILSVSNLQNAGVASHLGAYATPGAAGIVLGTTGTTVPNHPIATLRYTGASMGAAIDRGITLAGNSTVDLPIAGDMRLGSLALASDAAITLNVTGSGISTSRLYIDSVVVPTSTTRGNGPYFSPTTASLTIGTITGNGSWGIRGTGNHIVTGPINLGVGFTGYGTQRDYGQIAGFSTGGSWTFLSDNTFAGRWTYGGGATLIFKSPGTVISGQNVSYAFGKSTTQDWIATDSDTTYKTFWGNSTIHLLNDVSTSYETGFAPGRKTPVMIAGNSTTTILVDRQGASATNQTHSLGDMWMRESHNLTVNGNNGFGLSLDTVRVEDARTQSIIANTNLTLANLRKIGTGTNILTIRGTGTTTINGVVERSGASGTLTLTKTDAGTLILNGANSVDGTITVSGGKLVAAHANALGPVAQATTVSSGATLDVRAALVAEPISVTGTGVGGFGALITATANTGTVTGTLTLTGNTSIGGAGTGILNINGIVAAGANTLTTLGTGVTTFGAASDLTSLTNLVVTDGTTNVNSALGTAGNAVVTVSDSPVTKLRFGSVSQTLTSLTIGAGATVIFTSGLASGALTGDDGGSKAAGFGSPASSFGGGATVPEPGTLGLLLVGALGMLNRRRRRA